MAVPSPHHYLDQKKKKYYFIDFWGVWCKPCIAQFLKLAKIYDTFNPVGFDILSFSFDINKSTYLEFMQKNGLKWLNITDLKGSNSDVFTLFNLNALPANFLIDENKNIVEVNITPDMLEKILEENLPVHPEK